MKWVKTVLVTAFSFLVCASMREKEPSTYTSDTVRAFQADAQRFAVAARTLKQSVAAISPDDTTTLRRAKEALIACRNDYKRIEFFMEYYFEYPVNLYNRAPVYEVEEPFMEYQAPVGLQVVEDLLLDKEAFANKKELLDQCEVISTTADDIPSILYEFKTTDAQLLEAVRLELIRITTLGISGYDAPKLKTGITEAATAMHAIKANLGRLPHLPQEEDSVFYYVDKSVALLEAHPEFNGFDRLQFLTDAMLPLQKHFGIFLRTHQLEVNTHQALNYQADHLFSRDAFDVHSFCGNNRTADPELLAALGRELFFEVRLSGNGKRSCATCHQPERYFTDGLAKSRTLDGKGEVTRNAPTLYYAAFQRMQFHDARAGSLEEQIAAVLQNPREMDANLKQVVSWLNKEEHYKTAFRKAFRTDSAVDARRLATALAAFEQTLAPFSSPFDGYLAGNHQSMSTAQIRGFNLFMGKAQCGTCHFAPLFNGLLPPYYERTEVEVLGVPKNGSLKHPRPDTDSGRYSFFGISFNNGAFKTSTVRNSAMTAPYMHNGAFKTLKQVVEFYNRGGGAGLGMKIDNQTLSDDPLHLSPAEVKDITAFLEALTDKPSAAMSHP